MRLFDCPIDARLQGPLGLQTSIDNNDKSRSFEKARSVVDLTEDVDELLSFSAAGEFKQLATRLTELADDYLVHCHPDSLMSNSQVLGLSDLWAFIGGVSAAILNELDDPILSKALVHFLRCLCTVFEDIVKCMVETDFFIAVLARHLDNATPDIAVNLLHIARRVWMFAIKTGRLECSVVFGLVQQLPLVSEAYAKQIIYVIRALVEIDETCEYSVPDILSNLLALLCRFPSWSITKRVTKTAYPLVEVTEDNLALFVSHPLFDQLLAELAEPLNGDCPVELVDLILHIVHQLGPVPVVDAVKGIPLSSYTYLLLECGTETAAASLKMVAFLIAYDEDVAEAFCEIAPEVADDWDIRALNAPGFLETAWLIFCHAVLFRIGAPLVGLFVDLNVIGACLKYLSGNGPETTAYSIAILSLIMLHTNVTDSYDAVICQLCSTDDIRAMLTEIIDDGDRAGDVVIGHLESKVNVVQTAQDIMAALPESDEPSTFLN
jgi:hypothetical protein